MYYPTLAIHRLAAHFGHDWGTRYGGQDISSFWINHVEPSGINTLELAINELRDRWFQDWNKDELARLGLPGGLGPALEHETLTGRYGWSLGYVGDLYNRPGVYHLDMSIGRRRDPAGDDGGWLNGGRENVATATIEFRDDTDHRGELVEVKISIERAEPRHAGYLAELILCVQGLECAGSVFARVNDAIVKSVAEAEQRRAHALETMRAMFEVLEVGDDAN